MARSFMARSFVGVVPVLLLASAPSLLSAQEEAFTRADTLRGTNGAARSWWDVTFYDLDVRINPSDRTISGSNAITYRVMTSTDRSELQIDLQAPLQIDSVFLVSCPRNSLS